MGDVSLLLLLAALVLDWIAGEPEFVWSRIPHPVVMFGKAVEIADRLLNISSDSSGDQLKKGAVAIAGLVLIAIGAGVLLEWISETLGMAGFLLEILVIFTLVAQRSLIDHVGAVATGLTDGGLAGGRQAVAHIVGRDPEQLDAAGVSRAAIESLAENFSDGVVAPVFWYAVFGLPGIMAYKMINTGDSMIGHKSDKYLWFGRTVARLDDLANWVPARLSAGLIALAALLAKGPVHGRNSIQCAFRDAGLHRSPNAGWPEAAMAGACGVALGGPRHYGQETVQQSWINAAGDHEPGPGIIWQAISLTRHGCFVIWGMAGLGFLLS